MPRPPTPTKVLALRGSWRAKTRPQEPNVLPAVPSVPRELDAQAKRIWRRITVHLDAIGILAAIDQHALARYIQLWQRWQRLHAFIVEHGETYDVYETEVIDGSYDEESGTFRPRQHEKRFSHTQIRAETRAWMALSDRLLRLENTFGMTPSGRAAIGLMLAGASRDAAKQEAPDPRRFLNLG